MSVKKAKNPNLSKMQIILLRPIFAACVRLRGMHTG